MDHQKKKQHSCHETNSGKIQRTWTRRHKTSEEAGSDQSVTLLPSVYCRNKSLPSKNAFVRHHENCNGSCLGDNVAPSRDTKTSLRRPYQPFCITSWRFNSNPQIFDTKCL